MNLQNAEISANVARCECRAVEAAQDAFAAWSALSVHDRARHVRELGRQMQARSAETLEVEVADTGSTVGKLKGDVGHAAGALEQFAGLGLELKGEPIPASTNNLHLTVHDPFGVVGRIAPFSHPIYFAGGGMAAPLMAGNTVAVKPPEQSPIRGRHWRDLHGPGGVQQRDRRSAARHKVGGSAAIVQSGPWSFISLEPSEA